MKARLAVVVIMVLLLTMVLTASAQSTPGFTMTATAVPGGTKVTFTTMDESYYGGAYIIRNVWLGYYWQHIGPFLPAQYPGQQHGGRYSQVDTLQTFGVQICYGLWWVDDHGGWYTWWPSPAVCAP